LAAISVSPIPLSRSRPIDTWNTKALATAGPPEAREYRIRAGIDDVEIGEYSATRPSTVR
jgi:hypothetical protein